MPCILHYNAKKIRDTISRLVRDLAQKAKSSEILRRSRIQHLQKSGGETCTNVFHPNGHHDGNMKKNRQMTIPTVN